MKICVPIREKSQKKAIKRAKLAFQREADLIEIWPDRLKNPDIISFFSGLPGPFISKLESPEYLQDALRFSAYIDIDVRGFWTKTNKMKAKLILSYHNFQKTESLKKLLRIANQAFAKGADIVKIATAVKKYEDNVTLFELIARLKEAGKKAIIIGMGEKGKISRIGCLILGGFLTYAALDERSRTADGQLTIKEICRFK